jgi:hypothetical protein
METKINDIYHLLSTKSCTKQQVYRNTLEWFSKFKKHLSVTEKELSTRISGVDSNVEIRYTETGPFEAHLKFSGDTMVFMMHTNVFDFTDEHYINKNPYILEDKMREYCGLIQVYNFLSDSIKYNRIEDVGVLVARIFINKENHFFIEGRRPLSFMFNDISKHILSEESIQCIIEEAMLFCLNFDLIAPPLEAVNFITIDQKNMESYSSGSPTSKTLGFQMNRDSEK